MNDSCPFALYVGGVQPNGQNQFGLGALTNRDTGAYANYNLSAGLLQITTLWEYIGNAGTGIFTQTGGTNITSIVDLSGQYHKHNATGNLTTLVYSPGTYNLNGGMLQTGWVRVDPKGKSTLANLTFTGGTLQAAVGGLINAVPTTVGTAASNLATIDANGQVVNLNAGFSLAGPGQLRVIDSAGGGMIVLGNSDGTLAYGNSYTGGTTVLSGTLQVLERPGPAQRGRFDHRRAGTGVRAAFNLNGTQQTTEGLATARAWSVPISTSKCRAPIC